MGPVLLALTSTLLSTPSPKFFCTYPLVSILLIKPITTPQGSLEGEVEGVADNVRALSIQPMPGGNES